MRRKQNSTTADLLGLMKSCAAWGVLRGGRAGLLRGARLRCVGAPSLEEAGAACG